MELIKQDSIENTLSNALEFPQPKPSLLLSPTENEKARIEKVTRFVHKSLSATKCPKKISGPTYFNDIKKQRQAPWHALIQKLFASPMDPGYKELLIKR